MKYDILGKFIYDSETGVMVHNYRNKRFAGKEAGTVNSGGCRVVNSGTPKGVHRIVWEAINGPVPDGYEIDHKDRNKLNNRLSNLRLVTHSENNLNKGRRSDNKTGLPGMVWRARDGYYEVYGVVGGRWKYLGKAHDIVTASELRKRNGCPCLEDVVL